MQVEPSKSEEVTWPTSDTHHQFFHIWSSGGNFEFPFLDLESPQNLGLDASWTIQFGGGHLTLSGTHIHIGSYGEIFKFPSLNLESPENLGLDASWTIQFGGGHLTCSWSPHHYLEHNRSHRPNQAFLFADSQSPWKMGPGTGQTIQIGGGQFLNRRLSASISHFTA